MSAKVSEKTYSVVITLICTITAVLCLYPLLYTLMVSVWGIGGLILLSLGVVGEYIGKIYLETKARPRFIVEEFLHEDA